MNQNTFESFMQNLGNLEAQQRIVHQNEYFSVIDQGSAGEYNDDGKLNQWFKVQLKGLLNPKLNIVQSYKLLNPFSQISKKQNRLQQHQYETKSRRVQYFLSKLQKLSSNMQGKTMKIKIKQSLSLFFLYFLKRVYNTVWKRCGDNDKIQREVEDLSITVLYGFYKMRTQGLQQMLLLFELLEFDKLPITTQQKNYHIAMQHFLLYKLYKTYGISNDWSEKYQKILSEIDEKGFEQLYEFELKLKQHTIDPSVIERSIIEHRFYCNRQQEITTRQMISYLLENLRNYKLPQLYTHYNKQEFEMFGLKVRKNQKNQNRQQESYNNDDNEVRDNNNKKKQKELLPTLKQLLKQLDMQYLQKDSKFEQTLYLTLKKNFSFNQQSQNQPLYLYQLKSPQQVYNSSQQMFDSLISIIVIDYFQWFKLFRRKTSAYCMSGSEFQLRKYLICLISRTLIWKKSIGRLEYDKLEMWKLLFSVEYNPSVVDIENLDMSIIDKIEPNLQNVIHSTIQNIIRDELLQPICIPCSNISSINQQKQSNYFFIFPFLNLLLLAYELNSQPLNDFVNDIKKKYKHEKLSSNILSLAKDLYQQFIDSLNASKQQNQIQKNDNIMTQQQQQRKNTNTQQTNHSKLQTYSKQMIIALLKYQNKLIDAEIKLTK